MDRFHASPLPSAALEDWRYSRIDALDLDRYRPVTGIEAPTDAQVPGAVAELVGRTGPATVVVVRNGAAVGVNGTDPAVTVTFDDARPGAVAGEPDALTTLNAAFALPVTVTIAAGARPKGPVVIVHDFDTDGAASFPRTVVVLGTAAEATVIEMATSGDVDALVVPVTELEVADGANLGYVHVQQLGPRVWQTGLQASRVGRDATVTSASVAIGGDYARMRTTSSLVGQGGTARLLAVYFGAGTRMVDYRTTQDHRAPKTTSELLFKGAVANQSSGVYSGLIHVEKGAGGTNAFQTNRNLVLHEGAHAESVPNLEIEDNDVRCSHASAVGPVADDERFYLESRGVPPDVAARLITLGFLDEVLERLPVAAVADHVRLELAGILDEADRVEAAGGIGADGAPAVTRR